MAQPLTDAIEALTTYANTVTGASDTTLSEAVATLASGYGGGFTINDILTKNISQTNVVWDGTGTLQYICLSGNDIESIELTNLKAISSCPNLLRNTTSLKSLSAPNLTSMTASPDLLNGCTNLETVNMPKVSSISGCDRFAQGCTKLTTVHLENCTDMGTNTFYNCTSLASVTFPKSTVFSGNNFYNCSSLQIADILASARINAGTFQNCTVLNKLIIRKTGSVAQLNNINAFASTPFASNGTGGTLYVPQALISSYQTASNWSTILGYPNNSIQAIEGSYYETHYADGTPIE